MIKKLLPQSTILLALILSACVNQPRFSYNSLSLSDEQKQYIEQNYTLIQTGASTTINRFFFVYIPVNGYYPFTDEVAFDKLLREYNGDLVQNAKIQRKILILGYFNIYYVVASGDIWRKNT